MYYPGTFEPLALIEPSGAVQFYHNDPNGLPRELTNRDGQILWLAKYSALGEATWQSAAKYDQPLRLQGQYFDCETGLHYNRHRYYDPVSGAFASQDPL